IDSTFTGNSATGTICGGTGGGIENAGTLTVRGSTFAGNSAAAGRIGGGDGGGIENAGGTLTVSDSTFTGNSAGGNGGGIDNKIAFSRVTVINSTFTGNSARNGGGVFNTTRVICCQGIRSTVTVGESPFAHNT